MHSLRYYCSEMLNKRFIDRNTLTVGRQRSEAFTAIAINNVQIIGL